jgi:hypothetical protein
MSAWLPNVWETARASWSPREDNSARTRRGIAFEEYTAFEDRRASLVLLWLSGLLLSLQPELRVHSGGPKAPHRQLDDLACFNQQFWAAIAARALAIPAPANLLARRGPLVLPLLRSSA